MKLTHLDEKGMPKMVDVSQKADTVRIASAHAKVSMSKEAFNLAVSKGGKKGDVFGTAKIAGIMAAKQTSGLIPLCHPLNIEDCDITFEPDENESAINIKSTVKISGKTGVEMESLTAASVAALTIYDMLKAVDKSIEISEIYLITKEGGKSGLYTRIKEKV
ncbi:MAG: cyclic pyranopterin monophosphate synthase MoaC [Candidatus Acidulodesulfobacterium ferriphilum]|uniref:Cyclic pyranopterin monophosphate synthase n=1 Tax=Candidatus Acidulodesulfobacterium ferriphilum TaxID=2597223 RepID=A0A519B9K9_9DELT|nr:MAG: cyclic pyranopterin monophosphate synthase MoaC [Candidatus Acidulodesulfobacterium ferriphilum]